MGNEVHFEIDPAEYLHERVPGRVGRNAPGEVRGECVDVSDSNLNQIHIPLRLTYLGSASAAAAARCPAGQPQVETLSD